RAGGIYPGTLPLDIVDVLGMIEKGIVPIEMELVLEQSQQGSSHEVLVSTEGVEELKKLRTRKGQVFDSRYGLFHKVNRGESHGNNHRQSGEEVREGQHSMLFQSPKKNSLGQRETSVVQWTRRESKSELRVCGVTFRPGDFVYRSNEASHAMDGGKLGPKWEGPYEVTEVLRDGAYRLRSMDGTVLLRT
nr:reverse transcriptase domain-containing protein [Tanacetum cinerariifolium]